MSEYLFILNQVTSFLDKASELLKGKSKEKTERLEISKRFVLNALKAEHSIIDLLSYRIRYQSLIESFIKAVKKRQKNQIKEKLTELLEIFPLPNIPAFPEDDFYLLMLNIVTKKDRNDIERINEIAQQLKENPENIKLLSEFYVRISIFAIEPLDEDCGYLYRFWLETGYGIIGKRIETKDIDEIVKKNVEGIRKMNESEMKFATHLEKGIEKTYKKLKSAINTNDAKHNS